MGVVASRSFANAEAFAGTIGGRPVESYAAAVAADVDAVYIATPPSLHEEHAALAFDAGRPALIEKPLASDAAAARRIAALAASRGVFAMEAMWTRFLPLLGVARERIDAGALGELRAFEGAFLGATRVDAAASLFDPERGGGALLNRGVYPLSLARFLMGPVAEVQGFARFGATGVDEDCSLMLRHASGAMSTIRASLVTAGEPPVSVYGTGGTLRFSGPVWRPVRAELTPVRPGSGMRAPARFETLRETAPAQAASRRVAALKRLLNRGAQTVRAPLHGSGYQYEAAEAMACIRDGRPGSDIMPLSESIEILQVVEAVRSQWEAER